MRNLKALFCLVISNHLTFIANTSSLFIYCTISFGYRQPTFISHLLIGLSPFTFLEDGRLLSEKVKRKRSGLFFVYPCKRLKKSMKHFSVTQVDARWGWFIFVKETEYQSNFP